MMVKLLYVDFTLVCFQQKSLRHTWKLMRVQAELKDVLQTQVSCMQTYDLFPTRKTESVIVVRCDAGE